jgi:hypothetical protein
MQGDDERHLARIIIHFTPDDHLGAATNHHGSPDEHPALANGMTGAIHKRMALPPSREGAPS